MHGGIDGCHAPTNHHDIAPNRQRSQVVRLTQVRNEVDRVQNARLVFTRRVQGVHTAKAHAQEYRIVVGF